MVAYSKNVFSGKIFSKLAVIAMVGLSVSKVSVGGEFEIRKSIESLYPTAKVSSVAPTGMNGLYEATVGTEVIYADESGKFLLFGNLVESASKRNLTEITKERLSKIEFKDLPLELAVKIVKGDGSRVFATFEDPNCGYCKKLHEGLSGMNNYTMYSFLMPILSEDSKSKSTAIWCAPDRSLALTNWMSSNMIPAGSSCDAPNTKVVTLGQKLGVKGTPTMFFENGTRLQGYVTAQELETKLNASKGVKVSKL